MEPNLSLIGQMITFAVLVWFSMKFVFPALNAALDERAKRIADGLAAADQGQASMVVAEKRARPGRAEAARAIFPDSTGTGLEQCRGDPLHLFFGHERHELALHRLRIG